MSSYGDSYVANFSGFVMVDDYPGTYQSNHAPHLLKWLDRDRKNSHEFCDIIISVQSRDFTVHKCVVAASSVFFQKMFLSKMKETYEAKATVSSVSAEIMENILDFIYTGKLKVTDENVYELLCAADYLQIQNIKNICSFYLREDINDETCLMMWKFAKMYDMKNLTVITELHISANFRKILKRDEFKQLESDNFISFLALEDSSTDEVDIYKAVLSWLLHDKEERLLKIHKVFASLNLTRFTKEFLLDTVCKEDILFTSPACAKLLMNAVCERLSDDDKKVLVVVGGAPIETEVWKLNVTTKELTHLPHLPVGRSGASAVLVNNELYVLGGFSRSIDGSKSFDSVLSLSLNAKVPYWTMRVSMNRPRRCAGCVFLNGFIYMCGGKQHNSLWLSACERLNVASQQWFSICDMSSKRSEFALVAFNNEIYAMGGCCRPHSFLSSVERYCPDIGEWFPVTNMLTARARFAAAVCNDEIYVVGGDGENEYLSTVEKYSPAKGDWMFVASMSEARYNHSACILDNKIFVVGGNGRIEYYDPDKKSWETKMFVDRKLGSSVVSLECP